METRHEESDRFLLAMTILFGGAAFSLGLLIASAPLPVLLDRFIPDDAFYYLLPAKNFALHGFSSFDGIHFTNGYQPLWFLLLTPIFWIVPSGDEAAVRVALILQLLLAVAAAVLLFRILARHFGGSNALIGGLVWLVTFHRILFTGLETAVQAFLYLLVFTIALRLPHTTGKGHRVLILLGTVAGLLFLARTDAVFLLAALVPAVFVGRADSWRERLANLLYFGLPIAVLAGGYLLVNMLTTGHLMPVSGAAKQFYSDVARSAAGNPPVTTQLLWVTEWNWRFIFLGLVGPWFLLTASLFRGKLRTSLAPIRTVWPFYIGALGSFVFYSLVFYAPYTQTIWYYGPHIFLTAFSIAAVGCAVDELLPRWGKTGLVPLLCVGASFGWLVWPDVASIAPGPAITTGAWTIISVGGTVLSTLFAPRVSAAAWKPLGAGVAFILSLLLSIQSLSADLAGKPSNWNFNLYQGALWAKANLPPDATIWSGSAGILGYFSGHRVVNTDGLANDYEFVEQVLRVGKLLDYYRQWDYAIDAFPIGAESWLSAAFREGCWVKLPDNVDRPGFPDGRWQRRLQVFKMNRNRDPAITCEVAS